MEGEEGAAVAGVVEVEPVDGEDGGLEDGESWAGGGGFGCGGDAVLDGEGEVGGGVIGWVGGLAGGEGGEVAASAGVGGGMPLCVGEGVVGVEGGVGEDAKLDAVGVVVEEPGGGGVVLEMCDFGGSGVGVAEEGAGDGVGFAEDDGAGVGRAVGGGGAEGGVVEGVLAGVDAGLEASPGVGECGFQGIFRCGGV